MKTSTIAYIAVAVFVGLMLYDEARAALDKAKERTAERIWQE